MKREMWGRKGEPGFYCRLDPSHSGGFGFPPYFPVFDFIIIIIIIIIFFLIINKIKMMLIYNNNNYCSNRVRKLSEEYYDFVRNVSDLMRSI